MCAELVLIPRLGADIPNIDCVLVARPTRSRNIFAQMVHNLLTGILVFSADVCVDWKGDETVSRHRQRRLSDH